MIKVDEILMVIIGLLSLIIFYKIINGGLVEGAEGPSPTPPPLAVCCNPNASPKARCPGNDDGSGTTECPASGDCPPYEKKKESPKQTNILIPNKDYQRGEKIKTCNEICNAVKPGESSCDNDSVVGSMVKGVSFVGSIDSFNAVNMGGYGTGNIFTCDEAIHVCGRDVCIQKCYCKVNKK